MYSITSLSHCIQTSSKALKFSLGIVDLCLCFTALPHGQVIVVNSMQTCMNSFSYNKYCAAHVWVQGTGPRVRMQCQSCPGSKNSGSSCRTNVLYPLRSTCCWARSRNCGSVPTASGSGADGGRSMDPRGLAWTLPVWQSTCNHTHSLRPGTLEIHRTVPRGSTCPLSTPRLRQASTRWRCPHTDVIEEQQECLDFADPQQLCRNG